MPTSRGERERLGIVNTIVSGHLANAARRYPRLNNMLTNERTRPHIEQDLDRDFTELIRDLGRARVRATREELSDAFRENIRAGQRHPYHLVHVYERIIETHPGLTNVLDPSPTVVAATTEPAVVAHVAASAAFKSLQHHARAGSDVSTSIDAAIRLLGSVTLEVAETRKAPLSRDELVHTMRLAAAQLGKTLRQASSPEYARALTQRLQAPGPTRRVLAELSHRLTAHTGALAAHSAAVDAPGSTARIVSSLKSIGIPEDKIDDFSAKIRDLDSNASDEDAGDSAERIARAVNSLAKKWASELHPTEFGRKMRLLLTFVAEQPYHPNTELVFTRYRKSLARQADEMFDRLTRGARGVDYDALYRDNPKLHTLKQYEAALSLATAQMAEKRAQLKPSG